MVSFHINRIPTRSLSSRFSKLFSFSSFSRMPLFSCALLGNIWLIRQKLPCTTWGTWKGRGAPRWRVRTERTCTRWNLPGLNGGGLTIQSFKEIGLTQWEGEVVAHAQKLSKADHLLGQIPSICSKDMLANLVLRLDVVLLHLLQGEPHRVLVVGSHHHPNPLWTDKVNVQFESC